VRLRWRTRRQEDYLDRQLAEGADPIESAELSLRTGQLRSAESRERLAAAIERAVGLGDGSAPPSDSPVPGAEIRVCRTLLLDLAESIRDAGRSDVQGLAIAARLINDGASPLHQGGSTQSLASAIYSALFAMDPQQSPG
jgi:hypothetical protein